MKFDTDVDFFRGLDHWSRVLGRLNRGFLTSSFLFSSVSFKFI